MAGDRLVLRQPRAGEPVQFGRRTTSAESPAQPRSSGSLAVTPSRVVSAPTAPLEPTETPEAAYARGVREGQATAKRQMANLVEQQARSSAESMVAEQVRQALAEAEAQVHQHTRVLNERLERQHGLVHNLIAALEAESARMQAEAEDGILALAHDVVCRVLGEQGATLEGLRAHLQASLRQWHGRQALRVHLNPDDLLLLQSDSVAVDRLLTSSVSAGHAGVTWVRDPAVVLGGCQLRSDEGSMEARFEVQMAALQNMLARIRAERRQQSPQSTEQA